ncbi:MAG: M20/M25/M40 family metallo-hydrolase [Clostridia bacterium]|nr:M20/M25/M40 family metallo-hydrolase [Clostridia bacterium]
MKKNWKISDEQFKEQLINEIAQLIRIPSVSNDSSEVRNALRYVLDLGKEMGFRTEAVAEDRVGVIEWGEGQETLGILVHVDVVPPGPMEKWHTDPFEPVVKNGRITGLGAMDDKGMVMTCLFAMKAVADKAAERGLKPTKKVQLIIGTQEEADWDDMDEYVKSRPLPDYGFTPDGEFPYANIEKGILDVDMVFDISGDHIVSIEAGTVPNAIPAFAKAELADGRIIKACGKACHSCDPTKGDNAIFNLLYELREDGVEKSKSMKVLLLLEEYFKDCYGSKLAIYSDSEYYMGEWVHRNVFSPTLVRTEGDRLHVMVDVRYPFGTEPDEIVECLNQLARSIGGKAEIYEVMPAVFVPRDKPFLKVFDEAYTRYSGAPAVKNIAMGGSYAKLMPGIVSWGPLFPGEKDFCHEPNEAISIETVEKCFSIYRDAIETILFSENSFK